MIKVLLLILGNLWMLPNILFGLLVVIFLFYTGQICFFGFTRWSMQFTVIDGSLLRRKTSGWGGWAIGPFIFTISERMFCNRTIKHENRHVQQQMVFGVFQPILYTLASVFIWIVLRDHHSYYDNPFERDARKYAGQPVKIPKWQWKDPNDKWIWW